MIDELLAAAVERQNQRKLAIQDGVGRPLAGTRVDDEIARKLTAGHDVDLDELKTVALLSIAGVVDEGTPMGQVLSQVPPDMLNHVIYDLVGVLVDLFLMGSFAGEIRATRDRVKT